MALILCLLWLKDNLKQKESQSLKAHKIFIDGGDTKSPKAHRTLIDEKKPNGSVGPLLMERSLTDENKP